MSRDITERAAHERKQVGAHTLVTQRDEFRNGRPDAVAIVGAFSAGQAGDNVLLKQHLFCL